MANLASGRETSGQMRHGRQDERADPRNTWPYDGHASEPWLMLGLLGLMGSASSGQAAPVEYGGGSAGRPAVLNPTGSGDSNGPAHTDLAGFKPATHAGSGTGDMAGRSAGRVAEQHDIDSGAPVQNYPVESLNSALEDHRAPVAAGALNSTVLFGGNASIQWASPSHREAGAESAPATPENTSPAREPDETAPASEIQAPLSDFSALDGLAGQLNLALADNDAASFSATATFIDEIVASVVFVGGNVAVAQATNIAPLTQSNVLAAGSDASIASSLSAHQAYNIAVTDNDASAVALAGTYIESVVNSIIIVMEASAQSEAVNLSPVTQANAGNFSGLDDPAFQGNGSISDNDSAALANAGVFVAEAAASLVLPVGDALNVSTLPASLADHPLWAEFLEGLDGALG